MCVKSRTPRGGREGWDGTPLEARSLPRLLATVFFKIERASCWLHSLLILLDWLTCKPWEIPASVSPGLRLQVGIVALFFFFSLVFWASNWGPHSCIVTTNLCLFSILNFLYSQPFIFEKLSVLCWFINISLEMYLWLWWCRNLIFSPQNNSISRLLDLRSTFQIAQEKQQVAEMVPGGRRKIHLETHPNLPTWWRILFLVRKMSTSALLWPVVSRRWKLLGVP